MSVYLFSGKSSVVSEGVVDTIEEFAIEMGDCASLLELVPDGEVRRGSVRRNCISILVSLVEDELGWVLLILNHVEAIAARLHA